jgi:hypothetical protein
VGSKTYGSWVWSPKTCPVWLESQFPSNPAYPTSYTPDPFFKTAPQSASDEPFSSFITITEH